MPPIEFRVRKTAAGWMVVSASSFGPFITREQAVDLARGMVWAVRGSGQDAELVVEDEGPAAPG